MKRKFDTLDISYLDDNQYCHLLRIVNGINLKEMEEKLKVHSVHLRNWEKGITVLHKTHIMDIIRYLENSETLMRKALKDYK